MYSKSFFRLCKFNCQQFTTLLVSFGVKILYLNETRLNYFVILSVPWDGKVWILRLHVLYLPYTVSHSKLSNGTSMIFTFLTCLGLLHCRSFLELYASIPEVCINIISCSKAQVQFKGFFSIYLMKDFLY